MCINIMIYKYADVIKKSVGPLPVLMYFAGALKVSEYIDEYGNIGVYGKYRFYHPLLWLAIILMLITALLIEIVQLVSTEFVEFLHINRQNYNKGMHIGYIRKKR